MNVQTQNQRVKQTQARGRKIHQSLTKDQSAALKYLQEAAFVLAPRQLKSLAETFGHGDVDEWEEPDSLELLDDPDSELESLDADVLTDYLESFGSVVSLAKDLSSVGSPTVDPGDVYALYCSQGHCFYEPPPWMSRMNTTVFGKAIGKSTGFLTNLSKWLVLHKSGFLENPTAEEYVRNEIVFDLPVVTQDGLRELVVQSMSGNSGIDKSTLSRLSDKIWLFWPDRVMPLRSLFSLEFRLAWVVRGCLFDKNPLLLKDVYSNMKGMKISVNAIRRKLENSSFTSMDPIERLIYLCGKVKLGVDNGLEAVLAEIEGAK